MAKCLRMIAAHACSRHTSCLIHQNKMVVVPLLLLISLLLVSSLRAQQTTPVSRTLNLQLPNGKQHCVPCVILSETTKGACVVEGRVVNDLQQPVTSASVLVQELRKTARTDSLGYFCFRSDIPTDTLHITAHAGGYIGHEMIFVPKRQREIIVYLQREPLDRLPDVTVGGYYGGIIICRRPMFLIESPCLVNVNEPLTGKLPEIHFTPIVSVDHSDLRCIVY
ncbi:carboxypeptidase-like regulatory domain-containing protein [Filimonas effusa]|uniref:Carboxypeptidase regulatory-like domain-containing protein n=1 Tax=Filimonas effusa TaxID=2508721 RepID=A0A4Q1DCJ5_9BACT|nr:carboxypeptidase-like regulatory domain-containing protein [Filimonas effusa]RXK87244.1 carboxypeptidase regulatory-like domain-containing protein [Filimonas effusa]